MLEVSDVYEAEREECQELLAVVDWKSPTLADRVLDLTCPACSGNLLRPDANCKEYEEDATLQCRGCGNTLYAREFVPKAIAAAMSFDKYLVYDDGAEVPYVTCFECDEEAYVMDERRCAFCGHEAEHKCAYCGNTIPAEELFLSPRCGWCEHMLDKDD
jgi:hypothetical protein